MSRARMAPPWYLHPGAVREWAWLAARGGSVSFAVVNVRNGPGGQRSEAYAQAIAGLQPASVLGYVAVGYGRRPPAEVAAEIEAWQLMYGLAGIMLDELPAEPDALARCGEYAAAARAAGITFLAANPGVFPSRSHLDLFDVTAVFEGSAASYRKFRHPAWAAGIAPERLWHLVYACPPARLAAAERAAARRGAGHVFATDRTLPNPWLGPPGVVSAQLAGDGQAVS